METRIIRVTVPAALAMFIAGCALPKPHFPRSHSYTEFIEVVSTPPQFQWAYCGSDSKQHHFAQWRYGALLFASTRSSYLKLHKVPRTEMEVRNEFPKTRDMTKWRTYSLFGGDCEGKFARDFLRKGDAIKRALN